MFEMTLNALQSYCGNYICISLFMTCLIYTLFWKFKNKSNQLSYSCILIIAILANPLFLQFLAAHRFEGERISKTLSLLPVYIVIALVFAEKIRNMKQLVIVCCILILTQNFALVPESYTLPDNIYKLEQPAIDVSDVINSDSTQNNIKAKILATSELATDIRLYAPQLKLEVGRRVDFDYDSTHQEELQLAISSDTLDVSSLQSLALEDNCTYIVFNTSKQLNGSFSQYIYIGEAGGYSIYRIAEV